MPPSALFSDALLERSPPVWPMSRHVRMAPTRTCHPPAPPPTEGSATPRARGSAPPPKYPSRQRRFENEAIADMAVDDEVQDVSSRQDPVAGQRRHYEKARVHLPDGVRRDLSSCRDFPDRRELVLHRLLLQKLFGKNVPPPGLRRVHFRVLSGVPSRRNYHFVAHLESCRTD